MRYAFNNVQILDLLLTFYSGERQLKTCNICAAHFSSGKLYLNNIYLNCFLLLNMQFLLKKNSRLICIRLQFT